MEDKFEINISKNIILYMIALVISFIAQIVFTVIFGTEQNNLLLVLTMVFLFTSVVEAMVIFRLRNCGPLFNLAFLCLMVEICFLLISLFLAQTDLFMISQLILSCSAVFCHTFFICAMIDMRNLKENHRLRIVSKTVVYCYFFGNIASTVILSINLDGMSTLISEKILTFSDILVILVLGLCVFAISSKKKKSSMEEHT